MQFPVYMDSHRGAHICANNNVLSIPFFIQLSNRRTKTQLIKKFALVQAKSPALE